MCPLWAESGHLIEPAVRIERLMSLREGEHVNERPTRGELETANRDLRARLKRSEDLVSDCKDKLVVAYALTLPEHTPG